MFEKRKENLLKIGLTGLLILSGIGCLSAAEPTVNHGAQSELQIPPKFVVGAIPQSILDVKTYSDFIYDTVKTIAPELNGYDDVLLQEDIGIAYATGRDGWIWKVDINTGKAEHFVDVPVMPAGIHRIPGEKSKVIITNSRRGGATYPKDEKVGLYTLDLATREVTPLVTRVPHSADESKPTVFATAKQQRVRVDSLDESNSRLLAICNDAAVSADGKRIYFSESYVADGATMGGISSIRTMLMLPTTGRLWMYDAEDQTVGLVANGYVFTDGVLMEGDGQGIEESVLMTDDAKFQLHRIHLAGAKAGESELLWKDLPGLADGMRRDSKGRIWLSFVNNRGAQFTWAHAHPEVKPFLLQHPQLISLPPITSLLLLSPDASTPLWYTEHFETRVNDIAAVTPGKSGLYLANFSEKTPGLHRIDNPVK
jgi:sugar lactone lactonase YvrE